jgi:hypothetical protein
MNSSNTGSGSLYNPFSTGSTSTSGFKDFVDSNSLVAKIAFLLLVLFGFVIALRLGISILAYFLSPTGSPHLIDGMVDGKQMIIFPQDPNTSGAKTITRSVNANDGIEFTWSSWVFIDNLQYNQSVQSSQTHLIKVRNNIITRTPSRITDERRLGLGYAANSADATRAMSGVPSD